MSTVLKIVRQILRLIHSLYRYISRVSTLYPTLVAYLNLYSNNNSQYTIIRGKEDCNMYNALYRLTCFAYSTILRSVLQKAIDDPEEEWDELVIEICDRIFEYSDK
jgi:hypothetical protein